MPTLTDEELKRLMKSLAALQGLPLSDERIERDLVMFKTHLTAEERVRAVSLPIEAEPFVKLD
jgi:hypothetical protein